MLTPLTLIDQPDIDAVAVGVYPELSGIDKLLLFAAASAPFAAAAFVACSAAFAACGAAGP